MGLFFAVENRKSAGLGSFKSTQTNKVWRDWPLFLNLDDIIAFTSRAWF